MPYQKLLNDLMIDSSINKQAIKRKLINEIKLKKKASKKKSPTINKSEVHEDNSNISSNDDEEDEEDDQEEEEKEDSNEPINTYAQEVLCKDHLENEDLIQKG